MKHLQLVLVTLAFLGACSSPSSTSDLSGGDPAAPADVTAGEDTVPDVISDAASDARLDGGLDTTTDIAVDVADDATCDASPDAADVVPEILADAFAESPPDVPSGDDTQSSDISNDDAITPQDACLNLDDQDVVDADEAGIRSKTVSCSMDCVSSPAPIACSTECLVTETGLSSACASCYALEQACVFEHCLSTCLTDPNSESCLGCQQDNCFDAFNECAGFDFIRND